MKAAISNWLDDHMREVLRGAGVAFIVKITGLGIAFFFNIYLARVLGVQGSGVYFLAFSAVSAATVIARCGMDNTLLRFVAVGAATNDWVAINGIVKKSLILVSSIALVLTMVIVILADWAALTIFNKPELGSVLRIMALSIFPFSLLMLFAEMLRALKLVLGSQVIQGLLVPIINLLMLYALVAMLGLLAAPISYFISTAIAALLGWFLWRKVTARTSSVAGDFSWKKIFDSCIPLYGIALLNEGFIKSFPYLLLGMFSTSVDVGIFGAAMRTSVLVGLMLVVVNIMVAPKMAELYQKKQYESLRELMRKSTLLMVLAAFPILFIFITFPSFVMSFFGESFRSGASVLMILAVGQAVNVICGPVGYFLIMTGQEKIMRKIAIISALVLAVGAIILIPQYGAMGAALASALTLITFNLIMALFVKTSLMELKEGDNHG